MSELQRLLKNQKGTNGVSIHEHMCDLIRQLQQEKNAGSKLADYGNLEVLSELIKRNQFLYTDNAPEEEVNRLAQDRASHTSPLTDHAAQLQSFLGHYLNSQGPSHQTSQVQNWMQTARALEWSGVSFGETNDFKIQAVLQKLAKENDTAHVSFFGKVLAQERDYWVFCGRLKKYYSCGEEEPNGTGINTMSFWASNALDQDFVELPCVSPSQMMASRELKRVLKGNLEAKVDGFPCFPGQEKHLLKCQLARIVHSCYIVPAGQFKPNDDEPRKIEYGEDFKLQELSELASLENWQHRHPQILRAGKIYHTLDMSLNEEARQQLLEDSQANDPEQEALRALPEDSPMPGLETNWSVKQVGETQSFTKEDGSVAQYSAVCLKNLRWPGNMTIASNGTYSSVYIGYGYKGDTQPLFFPQEPKDLQAEGDEGEEKYEPNPKNAPEEPAEEKKEGEEEEEDQ